MKKINKIAMVALMAVGFLGMSSCEDVKILKVSQVLDGGSVEFLLAPQTAMEYDEAMTEKMDIAALIKPYNLSLDQLKSLHIESAEVEFVDSNSTVIPDFDIVDNMSVELGTSTIPMNKIAYKDPVPHTGLIWLSLDVNKDVDLIPYAKANDISYHLKLKLNKKLNQPVIMKLSVKWKVEGEI